MAVDLALLPGGPKLGSIPYRRNSGWAYPTNDPATGYVPMWQSNGTLLWVAQSAIDHGTLGGLADDDHTQYVRVDGTRGLTGTSNTNLSITAGGADTAAGVILTGRRGSTNKVWTLSNRAGVDSPNDRLALFNNASAERFTLSDAGGLSINAAVDPGAGIINANSGFRVANAATSGNYLRGNGTNFVSSAIQSGDLPAVSREIPLQMTSQTLSGGIPMMTDETATDIVALFFSTPATWDGSTNITITSFWFSTATGLKDIETEIISMTEVDENTATTIQAFTNSNLTWAAANTIKTLTTTITPTTGLHYRVRFRCNTGDASTGNLFMQGAHARTAWR